jgi:hypothetical protein
MIKTTNAPAISQKSKMACKWIGGGRLYGATHRMAEKLANGLLVAQSTTTQQLCYCRPAPTQGGSMIIYTVMQKYDLLKGG